MHEIQAPRAPYNQRHKFLDIIIIAVTAVLARMDTWNEIAGWAASKKEWLGTFLELSGGILSRDTVKRVFQMIEPEEFHDAFFRWVSAGAGKVKGVVAIDGKCIGVCVSTVTEKGNTVTAVNYAIYSRKCR